MVPPSVHLTPSTFIILAFSLPTHDTVAVVCNFCSRPHRLWMLALPQHLHPIAHFLPHTPQGALHSHFNECTWWRGCYFGVLLLQTHKTMEYNPHKSKPPRNGNGCNPFITTSSLWQTRHFSWNLLECLQRLVFRKADYTPGPCQSHQLKLLGKQHAPPTIIMMTCLPPPPQPHPPLPPPHQNTKRLNGCSLRLWWAKGSGCGK